MWYNITNVFCPVRGYLFVEIFDSEELLPR